MADSDKALYSLRYNQVSSNLEAFGGGSPQWTNVTLNNVDPTQVPVTRLINTTAPLTGGGNLTSDRTLAIPQATSSVDGFLLAADWTTFNSKLTSILTSANIFVGNGSNVAVGVALSGDAVLSNAGVFTLNTVNGNVGTFTNTQITVNAKGLITAASSGAIGNLTDAGTDGIIVTGGVGAVLGTGTSLAQHVADTTHNGYLSSTDWTTFNSKQAAGNYITALTGDITATGPGSVAATLATVNGNVGSFTYSSITVNAKGLITAASSGTAPVTSVSGTTNQINSTGGTTPVLSISSTLVAPGTATITGSLITSGGSQVQSSNPTQIVSNMSVVGLSLLANQGGTSLSIQGFTGGLAGQRLYFTNDSSTASVTLVQAGSGSQTFAMPNNVNLVIGPNGSAILIFNSQDSVWELFGQSHTGVPGVVTNSNATASYVGEYVESLVSTVTATTSGNWKDITSISLTAGDWNVTLIVYINNGAQSTISNFGISQTTGNSATGLVLGSNYTVYTSTANTLTENSTCIAEYRQSLSGTTTIYGKWNQTYTGGSPNVWARLSARRIR